MIKSVSTNSDAELKINRRLNDIRRFGHQAMSYSALQDGIKEFRHPDFDGFIAYYPVWGVNYVLSDPITAAKDYLKSTLLFCHQSPRTVFCQISHAYAVLLSGLNFKVNAFGVEHVIDCQRFQVSWKDKKCLKSWLSKLSRQDFHVFEYDPDIEQIKRVNQEWLSGKQNSRELKFLARPFVNHAEKDVRYFYLIKNKRIMGFCSFDPIYSHENNQEIDSYTLQHLRVANDAPLGSQDYLILNSLFQFKDEGVKQVSLGLAPLVDRKNCEFQYSRWAEWVFQFFYRWNIFYHYRTIGEHKGHYKADRNQTYIATNQEFTVRKLCGLLKVNNLI